MIPFIAIFTALILEISLGGFLGILKGGFHIYAATFIAAAFFMPKERVANFSFAAGLIADIFLNSLGFFGFFLVLYVLLGFLIAWLRKIFLKTSNSAAIIFRFLPAIIFYWIFYIGLGIIKAYFEKTPSITVFFNTKFLIGEIIGIIIVIFIFMIIWLSFKPEKS